LPTENKCINTQGTSFILAERGNFWLAGKESHLNQAENIGKRVCGKSPAIFIGNFSMIYICVTKLSDTLMILQFLVEQVTKLELHHYGCNQT
jgi:hypothetical protein